MQITIEYLTHLKQLVLMTKHSVHVYQNETEIGLLRSLTEMYDAALTAYRFQHQKSKGVTHKIYDIRDLEKIALATAI